MTSRQLSSSNVPMIPLPSSSVSVSPAGNDRRSALGWGFAQCLLETKRVPAGKILSLFIPTGRIGQRFRGLCPGQGLCQTGNSGTIAGSRAVVGAGDRGINFPRSGIFLRLIRTFAASPNRNQRLRWRMELGSVFHRSCGDSVRGCCVLVSN